MDAKDLEIIRMLEEDARIPFLRIAKRLRMSESAVRKRVRRLEREGIIERYTISVNPQKLGYNAVAIVGLDAEPDKFLSVLNSLTQLLQVKRVVTSTGDHMIMAEVWAKDNRELSRLVTQQIAKLDGVKRVCPAIVLERIK
jgi:Lrp/AsnC family transcriptional regulator for asnA, asnC and gidA